MTKHILIVDDDALLRRSLAFNLEQAGYHVSTAANAEDALALARYKPPNLILLDIGLPGMDGLTTLRVLRQQQDVPVIFLTAHRRELEEALGLELGADDYVTKPFDLTVLLAHIKAVLRRFEHSTPAAPEPTSIQVGDLALDVAAHTVMLGGQLLDLSPREFDVLHILASEAGHPISVDDMLARVWGAEYEGEAQVVYVYVRLLREKIEPDPKHPCRIVTVRGVGYKLEAVEQASEEDENA